MSHYYPLNYHVSACFRTTINCETIKKKNRPCHTSEASPVEAPPRHRDLRGSCPGGRSAPSAGRLCGSHVVLAVPDGRPAGNRRAIEGLYLVGIWE